jgi:signal transduction histidine kinase
MPRPVNFLIAEDSPDDAELIVAQLRHSGFDPKWKRVQTEAEFLAGIKNSPDIILSDYSMPQFSGLRAAELLRESGLDIPFILISGTVGEDTAVEAMRLGAADYLLKDRLARLGQAVERALEGKKLRDERKRVREELRENFVFIESVINSLTSHIVVLDEQGKIIATNQAWRRFALENNVPPVTQAFLGENYLGVCTTSIHKSRSADASAAHDGILAVINGSLPKFTLEYPCHSPTEKRWFSMQVSPLGGSRSGVVVAHENITERRKLEEQLRQSQKMESIGQLAGGVAHDFNNILAVISMQAGSLEYEKDLSPAQSELVREIESAVQRAADLTRQLLVFSRRQTMQPRDLEMNGIVANVTKMLQRILGEDIGMEFKLAPQPLFIHADAGMMDQVLMNLTVNARDAMPSGGRLIIETSAVEIDENVIAQSAQARPGSFACLSVSDTGSGIAPENLARIFEPFFTTKDVGKGTGLGLATVFGIVQQHQGWIHVDSEPGHGTTFLIYLPRQLRSDEKQTVQAARATVNGGNETILVVEDDPSLRNSVITILSRLGYRVLEASTGVAALEVWKKNRNEIRLLLTDLVMPDGMNGKELARLLLAERPALKVIYASGYSVEVAGKDLHLEEGVNFLCKPFKSHLLAQTIRAKLDSEI